MVLKIGDKVPHFKLKDQFGKVFDSSEVIGKKQVVLYFYPKDDTPGCTAQACSFRDQYQDFQDLGAEIIGISGDGEASHQKFAKKHNLPFILLSDADKKLRNLFGVPTNLLGLLPGRVTYVIDETGVLRLVYNNMLGSKHVPQVLSFLKRKQEQ